jgi:hypothetical protein
MLSVPVSELLLKSKNSNLLSLEIAVGIVPVRPIPEHDIELRVLSSPIQVGIVEAPMQVELMVQVDETSVVENKNKFATVINRGNVKAIIYRVALINAFFM